MGNAAIWRCKFFHVVKSPVSELESAQKVDRSAQRNSMSRDKGEKDVPVTRASSGVMVAHLIPTLYFLQASAASRVTLSLVASRCSIPRSKYLMSRSR